MLTLGAYLWLCALGRWGLGFRAFWFRSLGFRALPIGPEVVPFYGLYLESYKVIPKRNYLGAYG